MAIKITLIEFLQLSAYRGDFEKHFNLILCFDIHEEEEYIDKDCSVFNVIEYQDWLVTSFEDSEDGINIFIKENV